MSFSGYDTALEMRRLIENVAAGVVNKLRPRPRYGSVQSIDDENAKCTVLFVGDTEPVEVNTGSLVPSHVGQRVKVEGLGVDKCVTALYGNEGITVHAASTGPFVKLARIFTGTRKEVTLDASTPDQLKIQFASNGTVSGSWLFNSDGTAYYGTEAEANQILLGPEDIRVSYIPDGADLNSYIQTGVYLRPKNAGIGANYPDDRAGVLEVFANHADSFVLGSYLHVAQRFTTHEGRVFVRQHYSGWQAWDYINPPDNHIVVNGVAYQASGTFSTTWTAASWPWSNATAGTYAATWSLPRPYAPPSGYGFECFLVASSRFAFLSTTEMASVNTNCEGRFVQFGNQTASPTTIGWRLAKID